MKNPNHYIVDLQMFAEDQPNEKSEKPKEVDPEKNYAKAIADLKASSVPLADYQKLEEQNKQLLDAIINGNSGPDASKDQTKKASIDELRKELYIDKKPMTNLEYWDKTLQLRELLMEKGETDPFVPRGKKIQATTEDYLRAEKVGKIMKECVDAAGGDPDVFNAELLRRGIK